MSRRRHAAETIALAAPLAAAQIAQVMMGVTDTALLGMLGGGAVAAGGLAVNLFLSVSLLLQGVLTSVSVMVSQARGAGQPGRVPTLYWTGMALALALSVPMFFLFGWTEWALTALGEPEALVRDSVRYMDVLRWSAPATMIGIGLMRSFLPAIGRGRIILWVSLAAALGNAVLNYGLIQGAWGLPRLGLLGSAWATNLTIWAMALAMLALLHRERAWVRWARPEGRALARMLRLGLPVAVTFGVEACLFQAAGLATGLLGPASLAAHTVVLNTTALTFMVPLGVAQAANVRVGFWTGAGDRASARRAGFVAIGLGAAFMACTCLLFLSLPHAIVGMYLNMDAEAPTVAIAVVLLGISGVFQVADGTQVIAAGALRGLGDTRVPMLLAAFGYWVVGAPVAWLLAFRLGWGAPGVWWGLAFALGTVAVLMAWRFRRLTQPVAGARGLAARTRVLSFAHEGETTGQPPADP